MFPSAENDLQRRGLAREEGSLLIVALWSLTLIGVLAAGVFHRARMVLRLAEYDWRGVQMTQAAKAAVAVCVGRLGDEDPLVTALNQSWSADAFRGDIHVPGGTVSVEHAGNGPEGRSSRARGLVDEESKIPLQEAPEDELNRIFPDAPSCVAVLRRRRLRSLPELLTLPGVTSSIYRRVENSITLFGSGRINLNTAGAETLSVLGLGESLVKKIISFRRGRDGVPGTPDDGVFRGLASIPADLNRDIPLTADEDRLLLNLIRQNRLTVKSTVFSGEFTVRLDGGRVVRLYRLIFEREGGKIRAWREMS